MTFKPTKFKLWYQHQVPGPSFEQEVSDPVIGQKILDTIYDVALYQFHNKMIPDYCNMGGIVYLDEDGDWSDFHPEEWEAELCADDPCLKRDHYELQA
ncbi:hypothetical protein FHT44_005179 [Mycolicibacterium sp. BK634]|uniref:hypothetical protein n=1 Tax=Mycolicibacterium sp. BK634 TaxID=2587099 RepID=UPI00161552D5|nr:hypothetical protein [Mycolicibacterium sp. BK634]MBB3752667.1 hypothetical protein [Mycolicibacterium sp. BK634]